MDFDDLERVWDDCDRRLNSAIHLNAQRLLSILKWNDDARMKSPVSGDIDYTVAVVLVQKQVHTNCILRIVRGVGAWIRETCRGYEFAEVLQTSVMRLLRRHRTLRW